MDYRSIGAVAGTGDTESTIEYLIDTLYQDLDRISREQLAKVAGKARGDVITAETNTYIRNLKFNVQCKVEPEDTKALFNALMLTVDLIDAGFKILEFNYFKENWYVGIVVDKDASEYVKSYQPYVVDEIDKEATLATIHEIEEIVKNIKHPGSFVIARYLNRKKKYYGIEAASEE